MSLSMADYILWFAAPALQIAILVFMVKRKLRAEFPFFFSYTVLQVLTVAALFTIFKLSPGNYFYAYWTSSALGIMLGFAVIQEVFMYAIRPYTGLRDLGAKLFRWAGFVLLLVGALLAVSGSGMSSKQLVLAIVEVERAIRLMQCGLLLFIFLFSSSLGLTWKNFASGMALGYGVFAATNLVMYSLRSQLGHGWDSTVSYITTAAYNLSVIIWLGYSAMPESARQRVRTDFVYRPVFDRWNQAAMSIVAPASANGIASEHAYLSEIERTVETIMAQSANPEAKNQIH
jgi:hypothetical protein